jgi:hypothetical protein
MPRGILTDYSGSITTGGASQLAVAANNSRQYLLVQNISDADLWLNFGAAAAADSTSVLLSPKGSYEMVEPGFVSTEAIYVIGATTAKKFVVKAA